MNKDWLNQLDFEYGKGFLSSWVGIGGCVFFKRKEKNLFCGIILGSLWISSISVLELIRYFFFLFFFECVCRGNFISFVYMYK